jgi:predicted TIM-barrel fold metal-dependent hydrolase
MAETTSDDELLRLAEAGVRGVRFNLYRGGSAEMESVSSLGRRAWDVAGMHVEFYLDANDMVELEPVITALPKVSVDHLGMTPVHRDVLLRLVSGGVRVKATGFGRVQLDVASTIREIHQENPEALMFGTDLPSTRARCGFGTRCGHSCRRRESRPLRQRDALLHVERVAAKADPLRSSCRWFPRRGLLKPRDGCSPAS